MIKNPEQARAYFGYMEQKFSLFSTLSVIQNLKFFSDIYGLRGNQRKNHIKKMIEAFELSSYLKQQAGIFRSVLSNVWPLVIIGICTMSFASCFFNKRINERGIVIKDHPSFAKAEFQQPALHQKCDIVCANR